MAITNTAYHLLHMIRLSFASWSTGPLADRFGHRPVIVLNSSSAMIFTPLALG